MAPARPQPWALVACQMSLLLRYRLGTRRLHPSALPIQVHKHSSAPERRPLLKRCYLIGSLTASRSRAKRLHKPPLSTNQLGMPDAAYAPEEHNRTLLRCQISQVSPPDHTGSKAVRRYVIVLVRVASLTASLPRRQPPTPHGRPGPNAMLRPPYPVRQNTPRGGSDFRCQVLGNLGIPPTT